MKVTRKMLFQVNGWLSGAAGLCQRSLFCHSLLHFLHSGETHHAPAARVTKERKASLEVLSRGAQRPCTCGSAGRGSSRTRL